MFIKIIIQHDNKNDNGNEIKNNKLLIILLNINTDNFFVRP